MKKLLYAALLFISISAWANTPPEVNEKILKAFSETFIEADDVKWSEYENVCQATFKVDEIQVRAMYDEEGNLLQTTRHYSEKHLPSYILVKLNNKYKGKEVFGVTEISGGNEISYHVVLRDKKRWYIVESDVYGNLTQTQSFRNAEPPQEGK